MADEPLPEPNIQIYTGPDGLPQLRINAHNVTDAMRGADLHVQPGRPARLTLHLAAPVMAFGGPAQVAVSQPGHDALVAAGWTPPGARVHPDVIAPVLDAWGWRRHHIGRMGAGADLLVEMLQQAGLRVAWEFERAEEVGDG